MAELKTQPTRKSVSRFLTLIGNAAQRADCEALNALMCKATGEQPVIWGDSIVGFGQYQYQQKNGQKEKWPLTGFSPRKQNISIYIMPGFSSYEGQLNKLGKHKHSVSCLYISKLSQTDMHILEDIITDSVKIMRERYSVAATKINRQ